MQSRSSRKKSAHHRSSLSRSVTTWVALINSSICAPRTLSMRVSSPSMSSLFKFTLKSCSAAKRSATRWPKVRVLSISSLMLRVTRAETSRLVRRRRAPISQTKSTAAEDKLLRLHCYIHHYSSSFSGMTLSSSFCSL